MKAMPRIDKYMSPMPQTINADVSMKVALQMMRDHGFRHLPVQAAGKLVGILSDRDIKLAASFQGADSLTVDDIMSPEVYAVDPHVSAKEVVATMAERKYGCAVIQQSNGKEVGIFTAVDALRILSEQFQQNYKEI